MEADAPLVPNFPVAAVILAAGFSSRMGAFKPLLPFGDATVLTHVIVTLRAAGVERIHVVTGYRAAEMAPEIVRLGAVAVENPEFTSGMSSSVRAGVSSLPEAVAGTLLLPVDMPLVRVATIRHVLEAAAGGVPAVHPVFRGQRGHPPFIARRLFAPILAAGPGEPVCDVLAREVPEAMEVAVFDRYCLEDMDDPATYERFREALPRRDSPDEAECAAMLDAAGTSGEVRRHGGAVAELAGAIAGRLGDAGLWLDVPLVRAAALLHDIAKGQPHHAAAGAALIAQWGFPRVARVVASHMALATPATLDESAVVFLADKLVRGEDRVSLADRFAPALQRWRDDPTALAGVHARRETAEAMLRAVGAHIDLADLLPLRAMGKISS